MAKQTLILPQQKTFIFTDNDTVEDIDKSVNSWIKEQVLKGHHPSPSGPSVSIGPNSETIIVYMFATTIEK